MQPVQAFMQPAGMVLCPAVPECAQQVTSVNVESEEKASVTQAQTSSKKRQNGGGQRGKGKSPVPSQPGSSNSASPTASQASSVMLPSFANSSNHRLTSDPQHVKPAAQKSRKKSRRQGVPTEYLSKGSEANSGKHCPNAKCDVVTELGQDPEHCNQIIAQLGKQGFVARSAFASILPATSTLAGSKYGCRVIQKAIEEGSADDHILIAKELKGKVTDLYRSPNGNYVVAKLIEKMPAKSISWILAELKGSMVNVARHQYGCRLLERLLEHGSSEQVADIVEELLPDAEPLCRHPFGNFVMQHIFEHGGSLAWQGQIVEQIVSVLPHLAKHRTASHVVQKALQFCDEAMQYKLVSALLNAEGEDSLVEVGCSRYGSFVVEELAGIQACSQRVCEILEAGLPRLAENQYGKRAIGKFGFTSVF